MVRVAHVQDSLTAFVSPLVLTSVRLPRWSDALRLSNRLNSSHPATDSGA